MARVSFVVLAWLAVAPVSATASVHEQSLPAPQLARLRAGDVLVEDGMRSGVDAQDPRDIRGTVRGTVRATVLIHAPRHAVYEIMKECAHDLRFVPGLVLCQVLETAPDGSSQVIEQTLDLSWFLPKTHHVFRADFVPDRSICFHAVRGAFRINEGCWELEALAGDMTVVTYHVRLEPNFYVPRWLLRQGLRRSLPEMLRAMRAYCEAPPHPVISSRPASNLP
jgi:ribosome-associated toxin RatA of RatAB toxin-antitoxin module